MKFDTNALAKQARVVGLEIGKQSPKILVGLGILGFFATIYLASKATLDLEEAIDETQTDAELAKSAIEAVKLESPEHAKEETIKITVGLYSRTGLRFTKLYGPAAAAGIGSTVCILSAFSTMNTRVTGLTAAYGALSQLYMAYRGRVIEAYGETVDNDFRYGRQTEEHSITVDDGNGGKKKATRKVVTELPSSVKHNEYIRFFAPEETKCAKRDVDADLFFLKAQQAFMNQRLKAEGFLFLNDVFEALGFRKTSAGQLVGWIDDQELGDGFVDFGLDDTINPVHGQPGDKEAWTSIQLNFNVMGVMYTLIEQQRGPYGRMGRGYPEKLADRAGYATDLLKG
jgi:hypothetical protein